ncbi:MAG TPA: LLM class flavin-dependent oxidoreductase [Acidimicrobiia bacterium]|nr:LLM class flavin-dependent oxidoreductase [Acidimicrobiia bacterium]
MTAAEDFSFSLTYDMRAPDFGAAPVDLYAAAVEQCAWADAIGFAGVSRLEHYASVDGYLPSPIVLGSAVAAVTKRMLIRMNVVLLPLYDPVRLAEDLAVLDLISGGRLRLTVGAGYRPEEYEQFDLDIRRRPSRMEQGVEVLKQAWTGEPFEFRGHTVRVLPRPAQRPRPEIAMGGSSPAAARRAARIADDFQPVGARLYDIYLEELAALGKPVPEPPRRRGAGGARGGAARGGAARGGAGGMFFHIAEDPDRAWAQIAPHAMHETNDYAEWAKGMRGSPYSAFETADELRASGMYEVVTPDEAVELIRARGGVSFKPLMGGLDPALGWESLHLFESKVLPRLRAPS